MKNSVEFQRGINFWKQLFLFQNRKKNYDREKS